MLLDFIDNATACFFAFFLNDSLMGTNMPKLELEAGFQQKNDITKVVEEELHKGIEGVLSEPNALTNYLSQFSQTMQHVLSHARTIAENCSLLFCAHTAFQITHTITKQGWKLSKFQKKKIQIPNLSFSPPPYNNLSIISSSSHLSNVKMADGWCRLLFTLVLDENMVQGLQQRDKGVLRFHKIRKRSLKMKSTVSGRSIVLILRILMTKMKL